MSTRDPRSADYSVPAEPGSREPTESLQLDADDEHRAMSALAAGTADRAMTSIESPRAKTQPPGNPGAPGAGRRADAPEQYLGHVLGSYRLVSVLGKGGMGYVFRAEHIKLGREVALKLLRADYASRRDAVSRFFQEARTVNRVRHRNIVDVTDFVELDDGTTYIIMELLRGTSLGSWARSGVELARVLGAVVQICEGLGAAHQVGVVHRDLKPDNVIIVTSPEGGELVKLLDFGVAKLVNRDDEDVGIETAAGSVIGTPAYMSPEQAGGMAIDGRSDIYSLGAIMYELFCGQPMFRGRSFGEYVRKHLTEAPTPPHATPGGANLDPRLAAVILRCLEKDPDQRFPHTGALREALLALVPGLPAVAMPAEQLPPASGPYSFSSPPQTPVRPSAQYGYAQPPSGPHSFTPPAQLPSGLHSFTPAPSGSHSFAPSPIDPRAAPASRGPRGRVVVAGAAISVGLGVVAALWLTGSADQPTGSATASRTTSSPAPAPGSRAASPSTVQMEVHPAAPPAHPPPIELRFVTTPAASVFTDGNDTELCHTPCSLSIDPADGGPTERRRFVIRAPGYRPSDVVADLTSSEHELRVALEPTEAPAAHADHKPELSLHRPAKHTAPAHKASKEAAAQPPAAQPPAPPVTAAKPRSIEPTDTLDPFRNQ